MTTSKRVAKDLPSNLHAVATAQPTTQTYKITRGDVVANSMDLACRHMQNGFLSYTLNTRDLTSSYYVLKVLLCSASVPVVTSKLPFFPRQNPISLWKKKYSSSTTSKSYRLLNNEFQVVRVNIVTLELIFDNVVVFGVKGQQDHASVKWNFDSIPLPIPGVIVSAEVGC